MIIKNGEVFQEDGSFQIQDLYVENHKIVATEAEVTDKTVIDAKGLKVLPGLVDVHSHGAFGHDFSDADPEGLKIILKYEKSHGVTSYCPTSMTLPAEELKEIFATIKTVGDFPEGATVRGINMEGPFLDPKKKGAHVEGYIRKPDAEFFRELNAYSGNMVKLVTLAPNVEGAMEFIDEVHNEVCISLGHTGADYETASEAMRRGAHHVTHLYNAMQPLAHRAPGLIGAASDDEQCMVEMICDGIHIHPSVIRGTFRMFGPERIVLISDSMMATGMENGTYQLGGQEVTMKDCKATLKDGTIAGSATNLYDCMRKVVSFGVPVEEAERIVLISDSMMATGMENGTYQLGGQEVTMKDCKATLKDGTIAGSATNLYDCMRKVVSFGVPVEEAVFAATRNPAKSIGIYDEVGSLSVGKEADILLVTDDLELKKVL